MTTTRKASTLLFLSVLFFTTYGQSLYFNTTFSDICTDIPCNFTNASLWVPPHSPSASSIVTINATTSINLILSSSISIKAVTIMGNSFLSITPLENKVSFNSFCMSENSSCNVNSSMTIGTLQVTDFAELDFYASVDVTSNATFGFDTTLNIHSGTTNFTHFAQFGTLNCDVSATLNCNLTCHVANMLVVECPPAYFNNLVLEPSAQMEVPKVPIWVATSMTTKNGSIASLGSGFLYPVPFLVMEENSVLTAGRLMSVSNLIMSDNAMLNLIGGAYATVTSLSGTGMISLLTSQIYIGQSFFNGSISANSGSVVYLSGVVVNGPIYTDGAHNMIGLLSTGLYWRIIHIKN